MTFITSAGAGLVRPVLQKTGFTVWLAWRTLVTLPQLPKRLRSLLDQLYLAGVKSAVVTAYVALFTGMIVGLQVGLELARFGQEANIGPLVAVTMAREMAPFVTCIILAASVASALAAELGTMRVQDEITALEVLSIDVVSYLVMPRILALTIAAPLLTALADAVGILGGGVIASQLLGLNFSSYLINATEALRDTGDWIIVPKDVYAGLLKSLVFGFTIAVVGCASGLMARGGAKGVGATTRGAVRTSIIMIIILNFILGKVLFH